MICLKNRTFAVSQTTTAQALCYASKLWFAWKIVLLQYRKQQVLYLVLIVVVVICLKNRTFAVSQTTHNCCKKAKNGLWFAWKIVLLQYRKQHIHKVLLKGPGCDLLEKSYFCSIANNWMGRQTRCRHVVICLKNRTFAVSQTTKLALLRHTRGCDLLEKSYFCSIANNKSVP